MVDIGVLRVHKFNPKIHAIFVEVVAEIERDKVKASGITSNIKHNKIYVKNQTDMFHMKNLVRAFGNNPDIVKGIWEMEDGANIVASCEYEIPLREEIENKE